MFRKIALVSLAALTIGACTQREQRAAGGGILGAGAGAIVGAAVTGDAEGALVGAAVGGAAGAVVGAVTDQPGKCYARDQYNRTIIIDCPPGY
jgi:hypothetical protein